MKGMIPLEEVFATKRLRPLGEGDVVACTITGNRYRVSVIAPGQMQLVRMSNQGSFIEPQAVHVPHSLTCGEAKRVCHDNLEWTRESDGMCLFNIYAERPEHKVGAGSWVYHGSRQELRMLAVWMPADIPCSWLLHGRSQSHSPNFKSTADNVWSKTLTKDVLGSLDGWHLILPTPEGHSALMDKFREATAGAFEEEER